MFWPWLVELVRMFSPGLLVARVSPGVLIETVVGVGRVSPGVLVETF